MGCVGVSGVYDHMGGDLPVGVDRCPSVWVQEGMWGVARGAGLCGDMCRHSHGSGAGRWCMCAACVWMSVQECGECVCVCVYSSVWMGMSV
jgi:hypothetical protein